MKKVFYLMAPILLAVVIIPSVVFAADLRGSFLGNAKLNKEETAKNLYMAASTVNADGDVSGDLVTAGQTVNLNNHISQSLLAVGTNLNIGSRIEQNTRIAGVNVFFDGQAGQDVTGLANIINFGEHTFIKGDLFARGSLISYNGQTNGNVWMSGGDITLNGVINGDVNIKQVNRLKIDEKAVIKGNLSYASPNQAQISERAQVDGDINYNESKGQRIYGLAQVYFGQALWWIWLLKLLISFISVLILVYLLPQLTRAIVERGLNRYWLNLSWGLLFLVVAPVIILLLVISVIGLKISLLIGGVYFVLTVLASFILPLLYGALIYFWAGKKVRLDWLTALIGVIITAILGLIPIVGWLINAIFFLVALGASASFLGIYLKEYWPKPQEQKKPVRR